MNEINALISRQLPEASGSQAGNEACRAEDGLALKRRKKPKTALPEVAGKVTKARGAAGTDPHNNYKLRAFRGQVPALPVSDPGASGSAPQILFQPSEQ